MRPTPSFNQGNKGKTHIKRKCKARSGVSLHTPLNPPASGGSFTPSGHGADTDGLQIPLPPRKRGGKSVKRSTNCQSPCPPQAGGETPQVERIANSSGRFPICRKGKGKQPQRWQIISSKPLSNLPEKQGETRRLSVSQSRFTRSRGRSHLLINWEALWLLLHAFFT